jgi:hypothetical protein
VPENACMLTHGIVFVAFSGREKGKALSIYVRRACVVTVLNGQSHVGVKVSTEKKFVPISLKLENDEYLSTHYDYWHQNPIVDTSIRDC